jgi:hypothetical protein
MRIARTLAGLVLVGTMATACGGDGSDAPDDASENDFCEAVEAAPTDAKPSQDDVDEWVDKLKDAGTPDDIDDDGRHGFEVLVEALEDADVDDIEENASIEDVVEDEGDRADVTKFFTYFAETCADLPTDTPTGLPSEFPTDLSPDIPTDSSELPS